MNIALANSFLFTCDRWRESNDEVDEVKDDRGEPFVDADNDKFSFKNPTLSKYDQF